MSGTVKFYHSAMSGAPVLSGIAGALIGVLDACLVNGFGALTVSSLTVTGGVATLTFTAPHGYELDQVLLIGGSTVTGGVPGALNGNKDIASIPTTSSITFAAAGVADQTATGAITAIAAPAGWTKPFAGTNKAAYLSGNPAAKQCYLRVDESGIEPRSARVVGYEAMTDVDTGTGPFPTNTQISGGYYWDKSNTASSASREWFLIADDRIFYFMPVSTTSTPTNGGPFLVFGDIAEWNSTDAYSVIISGSPTFDGGSNNTPVYSMGYTQANPDSDSNYVHAPRSYTQLGTSVRQTQHAPMSFGVGTYSGYTAHISKTPYPNPADNGLIVCPLYIAMGAAQAGYRGHVPGVYFSPQNLGGTLTERRTRFDAVVQLAGRNLLAVRSGRQDQGVTGVTLFDVDGPWR
jgi:hypothetical protein